MLRRGVACRTITVEIVINNKTSAGLRRARFNFIRENHVNNETGGALTTPLSLEARITVSWQSKI
jgi:hypothetical protein